MLTIANLMHRLQQGKYARKRKKTQKAWETHLEHKQQWSLKYATYSYKE
jgi:hypothetical protein